MQEGFIGVLERDGDSDKQEEGRGKKVRKSVPGSESKVWI